METITLKMEARHLRLLQDFARARGCSKAAVVRELLDRHLQGKGRRSLHDQAKDLCGSLAGPKDLSTRKLVGYGRD